MPGLLGGTCNIGCCITFDVDITADVAVEADVTAVDVGVTAVDTGVTADMYADASDEIPDVNDCENDDTDVITVGEINVI